MNLKKPIREVRMDHIRSENELTDRTQHIHVTDLSRCLSGVWQEKMGKVKPEFNDSKLRRFDAGHTIESRVVEACKFAGILDSTQGQLNWPELNMVGSYDIVVNEDGQHFLVEVKSIHPFGMDHLYKKDTPHEHYVEQVNLYLHKLREEYPGIQGVLYYESLDGRTAEYHIQYDQYVVDNALAKARILKEAIDKDTMPTPPETYVQEDGKWKLNWRVQYCIESGTHYKCDPEPLHPEPKKWISKARYQATKRNK